MYRKTMTLLAPLLGMAILVYVVAGNALDLPTVYKDAVTRECKKVVTPQGKINCGEQGENYRTVYVQHPLD